MKNKILFFLTLLWLPLAAQAGDIKPGAVPGSINYQGRLERDNAPITGVIHLFFRIYNASSGGLKRWESPELVVTAAQGIFSANITPTWDVFSRSETLYLEVQVESDVLTPREPLNSVAYALVAKKLEDGASVSVTTLTAAYQVLLATTPYSNVGIGINSPDPGYKLTVNGVLKLEGSTSQICFGDTPMSCMGSASLGTAVGGVTSNGVSNISAGVGGTGEMHFNTANVERMRITDNANGGKIGIGQNAVAGPLGTLDVDGSFYVGNAGIYDRDDAELNVKQDLVVEGGRVRGIGQNYLSIGETADTIVAATNNTQRVWLDPAGNVGVGLPGPTEPVHAAGNIRSNTGVRGGVVSLGGYTGWTSAANEVRAQNGSHLLLQQNNPFNVGIGTDTPREKLHVRGSVLADYGVMAATAGFTGDVGVNGNFTANGLNKQVFLTSTTIYGTLQVTGGIGSMAGFPAYIASTQTLTGLNTFTNQVVVSSDILTPSRLGAAMKDFNFGAGRYLQVGDNKAEYSAQNTVAYLVGGDAANARLAFYRGAALAGSIETQGGSNIALVVGGQAKTLTDSVYHRIQNSVVWISTGFNTTPAIYVSSQMGNVGIGTAVADPTYKLTVDGSIRIAGPTSNGIVFADGSTMKTAASIGTAMSIANSGDAIVAANTLGGGGSVVLRSGSLDGLVLDSSGRVGVGTLYPVSKLNVRGGDLVLGTPVNPYSGGPENLIVAGNIVFDGALVQRSVSATQLSGLIVASDVYLSTTAAAKTGIGTITPATKLEVNGSAQFGSGTTKSTFTAAGVLQLAAPLSSTYGGTGANLAAAGKGDIPYFTSPGVMTNLASGTANYLLRGNGAGADPSWIQSIDTNVGGTIVRRDGSGNFAGNTITAVGFSGPLTTASQTAITAVGTLTGLSMSGDIAMGAHNISNAGTVTAASFSGPLTGGVTGNADTATKLATARNINGVPFDGTASITVADATKVPTTTTVNTHALSGNVTVTKADVGLGSADNTADVNKAVLSATKLATSRAINGVSFDGTADITVYDATKVPTTTTVNTHALSGNVTVTKADVGLGSADNTADVNKAVLSATKLATSRTINGVSFDGTGNITVYDSTKVPTTTTVNSHYLSGDVTVTASDVGLGGGITKVITVKDSAGANCTITIANGVITAQTCN